MYKSKLQVLCPQNSWGLPDYYTTKDRPDHNPLFKATVIVNGVHFVTDDQYRTAKSAQNEAAKLAFDQLSAGPPPTPLPQYQLSAPLPPSLSQYQLSGPPPPLPQFLTLNCSLNSLQRSLIAEAQLPPSSSSDVQHLYVSRLQIYTQKRKLTLPGYVWEVAKIAKKPKSQLKHITSPLYFSAYLFVKSQKVTKIACSQTKPEYSYEREGPSHASRFRCRVTIDGKIYESPGFFLAIKEAKHAVAKVAWESMLLNEVEEDDSTVYKNLLQELAQRKGLLVPKYERTVSGPPHLQIFMSTVEIGGESFQGQAAKSKKAADMNAAKIAYNCLQERTLVNPHAPNMNFPNGVTVLSFSDDKWVTLKMKMN